MVLRMGKTLEARTMPEPGGRQSREGSETGCQLLAMATAMVLARGPEDQAHPLDCDCSPQALETVVRWELGGMGAAGLDVSGSPALQVTPSGLKSCPPLSCLGSH